MNTVGRTNPWNSVKDRVIAFSARSLSAPFDDVSGGWFVFFERHLVAEQEIKKQYVEYYGEFEIFLKS